MRRLAVLALVLVTPLAGGRDAPAHDVDANLIVRKAGSGSGLVTSDPAGIECGVICSEHFPGVGQPGYRPVTLVATPHIGSTFSGWGGDCSGTGPCTVELDAPRVVVANFSGTALRYPLAVTRLGNGTVTSQPLGIECGSTCSTSFDVDAIVLLTAVPQPGWSIEGWSGDCRGSVESCVLTMNSSKTLTVTFTEARDTNAPRVSALLSSGSPGKTARLRYRVSDDSGASREWATVRRGGRTIATVRSRLAPIPGNVLYEFLSWKVPKAARPAALRFCVRAADAAGNTSAPSCAPLRIRK